jgi:hypothetical protein
VYLFVAKVTSGQNKRDVKGFIAAENLVPLMTVLKETVVRAGPELDSKKVSVKGGKDGKLAAESSIEILESVMLPDGKVRGKCKHGWVSMDKLGLKDTLAPQQVSVLVATDLRELTTAACAWLSDECKSPAKWMSTLTNMHSEGTLLDVIGPKPAPAAEASVAEPTTQQAGTLADFLGLAGLGEYTDQLAEQGVTILEDLVGVTVEDLVDVGIKKLHARKIVRLVEEK